MPSFDLRRILIAKYNKGETGITYSDHCSIGDAMSCNLELKFAEGRLYAEGRLAEYMKLATGGSISIAEKYIPDDAQKLMYDMKEKERTVGEKKMTSLQHTAKGVANYVGVTFYAPDEIDSVTKYTCMFIAKSLFGPPAMSFQTKGESIVFNTPTTTGEFLPDDSTEEVLTDAYVADTLEDAIAWCDAALQKPKTT